MNKKLIYIIRHGETDYNKRGVVQGSGIDAPLNETGQKQAQAFFEAYSHIPFDKIYTSALIRTHQSVKDFLAKGIPHTILPGLNEISWGKKEGRVPTQEENSSFFQLIQLWRDGHTHIPVEGGESPEQVAERQKVAFQHILNNTEEQTVLVAMHGRAMRILLAHLLNLPLHQMDTFHHSNLCLYLVEYDYQTELFRIKERNNTSHLEYISI